MLFGVVREFTNVFFDHLNVMSGGLKVVGNTVHPERRRWSEKMKPIRLRFNDTRGGS